MFSTRANIKLNVSIITLIAFYLAGVIGIACNSQTIDFLSLTPLNLLINAVLLLLNHQNGTTKQWLIFFMIALTGFFVEVAGVTTGVIFGRYEYQTTLGWKLFNTPVIIGVNWMLLTCSAVYTIGIKIKNKLTLAFLSACALVLLDILIEPVAMHYDFWMWEHAIIPFKNYIAWFVVSFILCYTIAQYKGESKNNLAPYLLLLQFIFFGIFTIIIWK